MSDTTIDVEEIESGPTVFLSYRRKDTGPVVEKLSVRLREDLGSANVYRDKDDMIVGDHWRDRLSDSMRRSNAVVFLVGKDWPGPREDGTRRIEDQDDPVRNEVLEALDIHDAAAPLPFLVDLDEPPENLPAEVSALFEEFNYASVSRASFDEPSSEDYQHVLVGIWNALRRQVPRGVLIIGDRAAMASLDELVTKLKDVGDLDARHLSRYASGAYVASWAESRRLRKEYSEVIVNIEGDLTEELRGRIAAIAAISGISVTLVGAGAAAGIALANTVGAQAASATFTQASTSQLASTSSGWVSSAWASAGVGAKVAAVATATALAVGGTYGVVQISSGTGAEDGYAWGNNLRGQLGIGTSGTDEYAPLEVDPQSVAPGPWVAVAAGGQHSCGIANDRSLWCWGDNRFGQVGNDALDGDVVTPERVGSDSDWLTVTAGKSHTCALKARGALFCWGKDQFGQVGNGGGVGDSPVTTPVAIGGTWAAISAGGLFTCGIQTDRSLWCWGEASTGATGARTTDVIKSSPDEQVFGGGTWASVDAGEQHTCAIKDDGTLWCWGNNNQGPLGDGTLDKRTEPVQESKHFDDWSAVSAGDHHTCAIRGSASMLYCWGWADLGRLGIGDPPEIWITTPQPVDQAGWLQVSAGGDHTCGIQDDGSLWCWGRNGSGQLAATTSYQIMPEHVEIPAATWTNVSAGTSHTLGTIN